MRAFRVLMIDEEIKERINQIVAYASQKEHWYNGEDRNEGWLDKLPGHNPEHICKIYDGYRCVFSYTHVPSKEKLYRHLSIGVDGGGFPSFDAVYEIARLFGFTGDPPEDPNRVFPLSWGIGTNENQLDDKCVVVGQEIQA